MKNNKNLKDELSKNLEKTLGILDAIHQLKLSLYKKLYPGKTEKELIYKINLEMMRRKERQWNLLKQSLK